MHWDLARQVAVSVATDGSSEDNVDPIERIRLEELLRVAELHVEAATGLRASRRGLGLTARPLRRSEWAVATIEAWKPLLEPLSSTLASEQAGLGSLPLLPESLVGGLGSETGLADLLGSLGRAVAPAMLGLQLGSAVGHLSRRALGQYDLPIPRPPLDELSVVPANLAAFASDWSLPLDDVRLWVLVSETAHHVLLSVPHVNERLTSLYASYVAGYRPDVHGLEERLAGLDPTDPETIQAALGDPASLVSEQESPAQAGIRVDLEALVAALEGYAEHVSVMVGRRLAGSSPALLEALRRRRVDRDAGERFVGDLFGLRYDQRLLDRGRAFVEGVVERAGEDGLTPLVMAGKFLPTPAEVDAPGLWLERIRLDGAPGLALELPGESASPELEYPDGPGSQRMEPPGAAGSQDPGAPGAAGSQHPGAPGAAGSQDPGAPGSTGPDA